MQQNIEISIIIPVYNTQEYLKRCLNSIINQSYKVSYEIICIDDGSTDKSVDILNQYKSKYPDNFKILYQKHSGQAEARNLGIKSAAGNFIMFIDSDDFIAENLLKECSNKLKFQPDVIIFGVKKFYSQKNAFKKGQYSSQYFPAKFSINKLFKFHTICFNKIYKKSFLIDNNIYFSNLNTGEEQLFFIKTALLSNKTEIIKKDLYIYRKQRQNALTATKKKKDIAPIINCYDIEKFLQTANINLDLKLKILSKYMLKAISWYGKTEKDFADTYFCELDKLLKYIKTTKGKCWWDYFTLNQTNSYIRQKTEYIKAQIIFFVREKLLYIPAVIFFFLYFTTSGDE